MKTFTIPLSCQFFIFLFISLFHTTTHGQIWSVVGNAGVSSGTVDASDIEVDAISNIPYVAFSDGSNSGDITVMKYDGTSWGILGNAGFASSANFELAVDNDVPYLAYTNSNDSNKVSVQKFNGSAWVNVGSGAVSTGTGTYPTIAIHNGTPYIAFSDDDNGNLARIMKFNGSSWVNVGSPVGSFSTFQLNLSFDNGTPYLAYYTRYTVSPITYHSIKLASFNGTSWSHIGSTVVSGLQQADSPLDLEFINNIPYISYSANNISTQQVDVMVRKYENSSWSTVGSLPSGQMIFNVNLITSGNNLHIFYHNFSTGDTLFNFLGGLWTFGLPSVSSSSIVFPDFAEQNGTIWVSYKDTDNAQKLTVRKLDLGLGLHEKELTNSNINLYPNPVSEILNIETEEQVLSISVYDIKGELIKSTKAATNISVKELPEGMFFVRIQTLNGIATKSFIKN